jgi:ferric-dicitrate binding protein FerR (iron transport regulator)
MARFAGIDYFILIFLFQEEIMRYGKFLAALLLIGVTVFLSAQDNNFAVIRETSGTVEIKAPGSSAWVSAVPGTRIEKNAVISTGFKSAALIALGNSTLTVRPLTRLSLEELVRNQGDEQVGLFLQTGRVRADVKAPAGGRTQFNVKNPSATASVRGTSFELSTLDLTVEEGTVEYSLPNGRRVFVGPQETGRVDTNSNQMLSPTEIAVETLSPALPTGSDSSGSALTDSAPNISPEGGFNARFNWE